MIEIYYIDCFCADERNRIGLFLPLQRWLAASQYNQNCELQSEITNNPDELKLALESYLSGCREESALIIGGHGHPSLQGFWACQNPVRWHDIAFLLRGKMSDSSVFIFYSCNGGYPGISHAIGRVSGPRYVFGPTIKVPALLMQRAVYNILEWCFRGGGDVESAKQLVGQINDGAASRNGSRYENVMRVIWHEGSGGRYPNTVCGDDIPQGPPIPLRGWGLDP